MIPVILVIPVICAIRSIRASMLLLTFEKVNKRCLLRRTQASQGSEGPQGPPRSQGSEGSQGIQRLTRIARVTRVTRVTAPHYSSFFATSQVGKLTAAHEQGIRHLVTCFTFTTSKKAGPALHFLPNFFETFGTSISYFLFRKTCYTLLFESFPSHFSFVYFLRFTCVLVVFLFTLITLLVTFV